VHYFYASCDDILIFASLTFSFVHQLQKAENTIFLVIENIFHSSLDGTMIFYTIHTLLVLSKTEIRQTMKLFASRKWWRNFCILDL
jgi:hypothetical protein